MLHPPPVPNLVRGFYGPATARRTLVGRELRGQALCVRLTDVIGRPVTDAAGRRLGRVDDLAVDHAKRFPRVIAIAIRRRRRLTVVPWDRVTDVHAERVAVMPGGQAPAPGVFLVRDLLDAQVVDIAGRRLARVSDILLDRDGAVVRVVAVDVGIGSVVRRLGLRRLGDRLPRELLAWDALHVASGRGHELQLASPAAAVHGLQPAELAELISRLHPDRGAEVLAAVPAERARRVPHRRPRRRFPMMRARRRAPS
jgi:sporulation protein YlmC with PRC-barrel domain